MKYSQIIWPLGLMLLFAINGWGQNRKELEAKRKQLIEEIQQTTNRLQETQKSKAAALDRFVALQHQIGKRRQLIETLRDEVDFTEASILRTNEVIEALGNDIAHLQAEYANMLRMAFRQQYNQSTFVFLFSASNLNQLFLRWQYLRQYNRYRKKQAKLITETQKMLADKARQLENRQREKMSLLAIQESQKTLMDRELQDKDHLVKNLKKSESRLASELDKQQRIHQKLNDAIETMIREEMAKKRKASRTPEALSESVPAVETDPISRDFQQRKGRLPWPVTKHEVIKGFGKQPHPKFKGVETVNNGVDVLSEPRAEVRSIFEGQVLGTQFIPGYQNLVIIQHGNYYTVYSNLEDVYVKREEEIGTTQVIGRLSKDKAEFHFELWRDKVKLNPEIWLQN